MSRTNIEIVVTIGMALGPNYASRLRFLHERSKLAPIDLPSFLRSRLPNSDTLQKVIVKNFLATAVNSAKVLSKMPISLWRDLASLE